MEQINPNKKDKMVILLKYNSIMSAFIIEVNQYIG